MSRCRGLLGVLIVVAILISSGCATVTRTAPEAVPPLRQNVEKIVAIGTSEAEFRSIFGQESRPSQKQLNEFFADARAAEDLGFKRMAGQEPMNIQARRAFANSDAQSFIFVGHNNQGQFIFEDGTSIAIAALRRRPGGPVPVILSCRSNRHIDNGAVGLDNKIPYDIAYDISDSYAEKLAAAGPAIFSIRRHQEILMEAYREVAQERRNQTANRTLLILAFPAAGAGTTFAGAHVLAYRLD